MNGLQISAILLCICASALVFLLSFIILFHSGKKRRTVVKRVAHFTEKPKSAVSILKRKNKTSPLSGIKNFKLLDIIENELLLANIIIKPEEFFIIWLLIMFVPGGLVVLFTSQLIPSATLVLLGTILPPVYIKSQKKKRTILFESQLGDTLVIISNCIRSGLTFQQALETTVEQMEPPISQEFNRVIREVKFGNTLEKALNNMANRVGSADLTLAVTATNIQRQTGGNLSVILDTISTTIKERQKIKSEIRVLTSTGRISGIVIGSLPIVIAVILLLINPSYIMNFFESSLGSAMLIVAAVMEIIGFIVVRKIINIKY